MSTTSPPPARRKGPLGLIIALLAIIGVGVLGYFGWQWYGPKPSDPVAAMAANNRGVGHMEQFDYPAAVTAFEEASRLAPDWLPAQLNLGIALLNTAVPENLDRSTVLFQQVLVKDPDNKHAHYGLGMITLYRNQIPEAYAQFEAVNKLDPKDAFTWMHLGMTHPAGQDSPESKKCFEEALRLNPYLNTARYNLAQHPHDRDPKRAMELLEEHQALRDARGEDLYKIAYSEMGPYGDVIGRRADLKPVAGPLPMFAPSESFQVKLAEGTSWVKAADLGERVNTSLRRGTRERFGGTLVLFDYDHDGRPDLFLVGAVVQGGQVRDLLLHNDGDLRFSDTTAEAGLAQPRPSLGCAVGDFDNDGLPDLFLSGADKQFLFRNGGAGKFEDVTTTAGLDKVAGLCLGSAWVDIDHDGDLDLLIARYADTLEKAQDPKPGGDTGGGLLVFLNTGEALPQAGDKKAGLTVKFRQADGPEALLVKGAVTGVAASDVDGDRDLDLIVLADEAKPTLVINDRLFRFHRGELPPFEVSAPNGALVFDLDHDERFDWLLVSSRQEPIVWAGKDKIETTSPVLSQAQATDVDLDGWTDILGVMKGKGIAVLLHNEGGKLRTQVDAFGPGLGNDLLAAVAADLDGDCAPDLLAWSEKDGLTVRRNLGNGHHAVRLELTGKREVGGAMRTNADGIGATAIAQAGTLWTAVENTTLSAGLGQSRLPLLLGIGKANQADVVRVRWPDGLPQAELNVPACELFRITETSRKFDSCPVLLTWDGTRFRFVTDVLGAGSVGEGNPDGSVRPPRPRESVKIESGQLVPRNGEYLVKIAEPMDELLYLDSLRLDVIDHPENVVVYPDERFVAGGPQPTQELLAFKDRYPPIRARDHRGRDVTSAVRERDRGFVDGFAHRSWLGFAEDHGLELDFGDQLAKVPAGERLFLVLAGWTEYPYPEAIWAADQAGVALQPPVLEQWQDGQWQSLGDLGFPAGLPRVMTREVTGLATTGSCRLRIRTNMQVYWDQVFLAPVVADAVKVTRLDPAKATLAQRGFMQEIQLGGRPPIGYDDERTEPVAVTRWKGRMTRPGDVTELIQKADDRFVLCGPGGEVTVRFDARRLPPLPAGWTRSFVLDSAGFCKGTGLFTLTGGHVDPLPFRDMPSYPYSPDQRPKAVGTLPPR